MLKRTMSISGDPQNLSALMKLKAHQRMDLISFKIDGFKWALTRICCRIDATKKVC